VFEDGEATNEPVHAPDEKGSPECHQRFETCLAAFKKLSELKDRAFPLLVEHFDDRRQSINFMNHRAENSVGDACYWNIYFQLQDCPDNYSEYGFQRTGRDGRDHPKPYWEGTPFGDAAGLKKWLEENRDLTYPQMQVRCLQWLLERSARSAPAMPKATS